MTVVPLKPCTVDAILFDFGGVLAEEGFRSGLFAIAARSGLAPEPFAKTGFQLVYETGYVLGKAAENTFWQALRKRTDISGGNESFRNEVLSHFRLRPGMMDLVRRLKKSGIGLAILSDQTNWLDELNAEYGFFAWFDHVFNSYHTGKSKREPSVFEDVLHVMGVAAEQALFVDDHLPHIKRAEEKGLNALLFTDEEGFLNDLGLFCPDLTE